MNEGAKAKEERIVNAMLIKGENKTINRMKRRTCSRSVAMMRATVVFPRETDRAQYLKKKLNITFSLSRY